jgi:hypothetical protein
VHYLEQKKSINPQLRALKKKKKTPNLFRAPQNSGRATFNPSSHLGRTPFNPSSHLGCAPNNQIGNFPCHLLTLHSLEPSPFPLCAQLTTLHLPQLGQQRPTHPSTPLVHSGLRYGLWPQCGHLETTQAVRLKSGSSMSLQQFIKFSGCGENCIRKFSVFQCGHEEGAIRLYWPAFQDAYKSKSRRACSLVSSQRRTTPHPSSTQPKLHHLDTV